MTIHEQDSVDSFFMSSSSAVNSRETRLPFAGTEVEEDLASPVFLFEANKSLFDLALENGFRQLGAE